MRIHLLMLALLPFFFTQCKPKEELPTRDDAMKFAVGLEADIKKRKEHAITEKVNAEAFGKRAIKDGSVKNKSQIAQAIVQGLRKSNLETEMYGIMGSKGSFERVKVYAKNGAQHIIYRVEGDGGFNYLDLELVKQSDKTILADILTFTTGENLSRSVGDLINPLMNSESEIDTYADRLQTIKRMQNAKRFKDAKEEFDLLPAKVKYSKIGMVLNIGIAVELDEEAYKTALREFEEKYGRDETAQLMMIDHYFYSKDYDRALRSINMVDSVINKDPYLDYYRGLIVNAKGDIPESLKYFENVTVSKPEFAPAYAELFANYVLEGDKANAKIWFQKYKQLKNADKDIVAQYEDRYAYLIDP